MRKISIVFFLLTIAILGYAQTNLFQVDNGGTNLSLTATEDPDFGFVNIGVATKLTTCYGTGNGRYKCYIDLI